MVDFTLVENVQCCVSMCCTYFVKIHKMTYIMEREDLWTLSLFQLKCLQVSIVVD
jgi:hypothetical protein